MNNQKPTIISLQASPFGVGMMKIDVRVQNVPSDLFGAAFHLVIEGADWTLYKYEMGDVFQAPPEAVMALVSQRNKPKNELIVGLSLKRGEIIKAKDGKILSFYIKVGDVSHMKLYFEDAILSILRQQRVDVENVRWEGQTIDVKNERITNSPFRIDATQVSVLWPTKNESTFVHTDSINWLWSYGMPTLIFILLLLIFYFVIKKIKHLT